MKQAAITLDTDWAPDAAVDFAARLLVEGRVRATWFVTHDSPAIRRLAEHPDLFEIGVHPNFAKGSSHGETPEEVLAYCMRLVPNALSMRTHQLIQSTPILDLTLRNTTVRCDASLLLSYARVVEPIEFQWGGRTLLRVPYVWEDDVESLRDAPSWGIDAALAGEGPRVFDFHPIHVALNSADMKPYEDLKRAFPGLKGVTDADLERHVNRGAGSQTVFRALIEHLAGSGGGDTMRDIYTRWSEKQ